MANVGGGGGGAGKMADKEKKKKESILDLSKYIDKTIRVKFQGGREASGVLKGFDPLLNLVLDGTIEYMRECLQLEVTHKDHQVQLLVPRSTTQNPNPVSESVVQRLLEQLGAVPTALGSCSMPTDPPLLFPQALLLSAEGGTAPLLSVRNCSYHEASPQPPLLWTE
uniref:LSM7 homolog, U6 small nuclear RNA and mRNA degradation associated n=1 Tax=Gallus gallus TaxID=9031 RepID=A0A8V1AG12_CHICK